MKLGSSSQEFAKKGVSTRTLKLFGTTVLVTDSQRPLSPTPGACKLFPQGVEGKPLQLLPLKLMRAESPLGDTKCSQKQLPHAGSEAPCCIQCPDENSNLIEGGSGAHLPWWTFCGGTLFPITSYSQPEPMKMHLDSNLKEVRDKEFRKEGSWTGSNSKSVNEDDNFDKNSDVDTKSWRQSLDEEEKESYSVFELKPSETSAFSVIRSSPMKHMKGFVPYKKRMAERDYQLSAVTGDEREGQRLRHCY